jgi:hypothetical protein
MKGLIHGLENDIEMEVTVYGYECVVWIQCRACGNDNEHSNSTIANKIPRIAKI